MQANFKSRIKGHEGSENQVSDRGGVAVGHVRSEDHIMHKSDKKLDSEVGSKVLRAGIRAKPAYRRVDHRVGDRLEIVIPDFPP